MNKKILKTLGLILTILVLVGFGKTVAAEKKTGNDTALKETLVIAQKSDAKTLDPQKSIDTVSNKVMQMMFDTLTSMDENLNIEPGLAEKWERVDDYSMIFHLRKGVKFHNGDTMTSEDVKYSLDRAIASPQASYLFNPIKEVAIIDENTVKVTTKEPFGPLLKHLSTTNGSIINKRAAVEAGDDVFKKISTLSGGEKGRVALAKIMLSNANFLILDEPTNHLDLDSKQILENVINNYEGTVLYISHDRYFINSTAKTVLAMEKNGVTKYLGNYDFYLEKTKIEEAETETVQAVKDTKIDWQKQKEEQALKRKKENQLAKLEERIEEIEEKIKELSDMLELEEVYTDAHRSREIFEEKEKLEEDLMDVYEEYEELS